MGRRPLPGAPSAACETFPDPRSDEQQQPQNPAEHSKGPHKGDQVGIACSEIRTDGNDPNENGSFGIYSNALRKKMDQFGNVHEPLMFLFGKRDITVGTDGQAFSLARR
jgi:hypothetical protein